MRVSALSWPPGRPAADRRGRHSALPTDQGSRSAQSQQATSAWRLSASRAGYAPRSRATSTMGNRGGGPAPLLLPGLVPPVFGPGGGWVRSPTCGPQKAGE
jgi:hypothetical protein